MAPIIVPALLYIPVSFSVADSVYSEEKCHLRSKFLHKSVSIELFLYTFEKLWYLV